MQRLDIGFLGAMLHCLLCHTRAKIFFSGLKYRFFLTGVYVHQIAQEDKNVRQCLEEDSVLEGEGKKKKIS